MDISLLILGLMLIVLGALNFRGNIASIHWYNRRKVREEDIPKYGRAMGSGTLIIGGSLVLTAVLQLVYSSEIVYGITVAGIIVGLVCMLYGQFRYNHGIF